MDGPNDDDEIRYNEMMKPITYRSDVDRKYKYKHSDIILRSKYRALRGRINTLKRLNIFDKYTRDEDNRREKVLDKPDVNKMSSTRDLLSLYEDVGMFSVISEDTSGGLVSGRRLKGSEIFVRNLPEVRPSIDGALRDYSNHRVKMWNLNLKNEEQLQTRTKRRNRNTQVSQTELSRSSLPIEREIQTMHPVSRLDSFDLTKDKDGSDEDGEQSKPKLVLQAGLEKIHVPEIDFLDGFDRFRIQDCHKLVDEIYFKPDEEIVSSVYVLKSEIPSVQLTNLVTVRIPVKIRFDFAKLKFSIRMKIGLVWRRIDAAFEESPGNSIFEGYIVFKTDIRGNFFATCDFVQFTNRVDKYGFNFRNYLLPDFQVTLKGTAMEEPEEVTFQIRLIDRERFSKHEDISPRLVYPITYVTDGLYLRRNKMLYAKRISPMIINISNDIHYETGSDVFLVREKDGRVNILGSRTTRDKKFTAMLDHSHSTFWFVVTKQINKYKQYEPIIERSFAVASERLSVCRILTFHENKKDDFNLWICIVEQPDVDETINKYLNLYGTSEKRLEMTDEGGMSQTIDFTQNTGDVTVDLDVNFKQRQYKELPNLKFKVGRSCRTQFKVSCRINPYLCNEEEKYGVIKYYHGSKVVHEVKIDTSAPIPEYQETTQPVAPEFSKEALEKILSAESLHNLAACLSEGEGFELAIRLGVPAEKVSKILIMYGSIESKTFRLILMWKSNITDTIPDVKDFIEAFYDIDRGDLAHGILDALDKCEPFKK